MDEPHSFHPGPADPAVLPGRLLAERYRIERALGRGGMGEVFLARDTLLHRAVALKRLTPEGDDRARRAAILQEARRAGQVNDRRIAAIHDVIDLGVELFLVMEYVDGVTLREHMSGPMPCADFWPIARECAAALAAAHSHGVIHRDIKPENLMITRDGQIKVLDFGIALRSGTQPGSTTTLTATGDPGVAGTPHYMAPEVHLGSKATERTDLFSLGVVFYELLTGRRPFAGDTYGALLAQVLHTDPPSVASLSPAAGDPISRVIAKLLAKDPAGRHESAAALLDDLDRARDGDGAAILTPALPTRVRSWSVSRVAVRVVLALAVAALAWIAWRGATARALPADRMLAVLAPVVPGADADFASLALGAVELLAGRLHRHVATPGFQMAAFPEGLTEKVHNSGDARRVLGATLALIPTVEKTADALVARLDLVDTRRGRTLVSRRMQVPLSQPFEFTERLYRESAAMLALPARGGDPRSELGIRGAGTLRYFLQGMGRARVGTTPDQRRHAVRDLELATRTEPEAAAPRVGLAWAQLCLYAIEPDPRTLELAEVSVREAIRLDAKRPEGYRVLGQILTRAKRHDAAADAYARALELEPTDDEACLFLARTRFRLGHPGQEKAIYEAAIARRPHAWQPRWWLANWYFHHGRIDESVRAFREMIRRVPLLSLGFANLGGVLVQRGDYAAAIDTLKHSIALRPTKFAYDNLGTAYFNSERFAEAVDAYNQSFQFGEVDYTSWLNLGDAYYFIRGRRDQAAEAYGQAVRIGREELAATARRGGSFDVMIPANLATVFPKLGQPDSARVWLARALAADSANSVVRYCAALTWWQLHEEDRAVAALGQAVAAGYPVAWIRDSPMFRDWRRVAEYRELVDVASPASPTAASRNSSKGGI